MARVLALDLATNTGWAEHEPGMDRPFFGSFRLPGGPGDIGKRADTLERFLRDRFILRRFTHIVYEAQHVSSQINIETIEMLLALSGIVQKFSYQVGIGKFCYKVNIAEWRKHFIGRGAGFGDQDPKKLAIAKCAQYGWHTDIGDEADALGVLDYFLTMVPGHPRPWRDYALMGGTFRTGA